MNENIIYITTHILAWTSLQQVWGLCPQIWWWSFQSNLFVHHLAWPWWRFFLFELPLLMKMRSKLPKMCTPWRKWREKGSCHERMRWISGGMSNWCWLAQISNGFLTSFWQSVGTQPIKWINLHECTILHQRFLYSNP